MYIYIHVRDSGFSRRSRNITFVIVCLRAVATTGTKGSSPLWTVLINPRRING